jgi:hypothetical protein
MEAVPTVDAIIEGFLQKPVKIRSLPIYYSLNSLRQSLYGNTNSFASTLGGGNHGYLGALMTTPTYIATIHPNTTLFVAPIFPGCLPAVQGIQAQVADQVQAHNENLQQWKEHKNVTKALCKQLIDSIEPAYIAHLDNPFSGFNKVLVKDILLDLFENYRKIRSTDLLANNKRFDEDWDPSETFQTIMAWVAQCCKFAINAGQPSSEEQVLAKTHAIVFNTGLYHDALEKYLLDKPTTIILQTYDSSANKDPNKQTSKQHRYGMAAEQIQELTKSFCSLVTTKCNEKENDHSFINLMQQEMTAMQTLIKQLQNKTTPPPRNHLCKPFVDQGSYCWTHGYAILPL